MQHDTSAIIRSVSSNLFPYNSRTGHATNVSTGVYSHPAENTIYFSLTETPGRTYLTEGDKELSLGVQITGLKANWETRIVYTIYEGVLWSSAFI